MSEPEPMAPSAAALSTAAVPTSVPLTYADRVVGTTADGSIRPSSASSLPRVFDYPVADYYKGDVSPQAHVAAALRFSASAYSSSPPVTAFVDAAVKVIEDAIRANKSIGSAVTDTAYCLNKVYSISADPLVIDEAFTTCCTLSVNFTQSDVAPFSRDSSPEFNASNFSSLFGDSKALTLGFFIHALFVSMAHDSAARGVVAVDSSFGPIIAYDWVRAITGLKVGDKHVSPTVIHELLNTPYSNPPRRYVPGDKLAPGVVVEMGGVLVPLALPVYTLFKGLCMANAAQVASADLIPGAVGVGGVLCAAYFDLPAFFQYAHSYYATRTYALNYANEAADGRLPVPPGGDKLPKVLAHMLRGIHEKKISYDHIVRATTPILNKINDIRFADFESPVGKRMRMLKERERGQPFEFQKYKIPEFRALSSFSGGAIEDGSYHMFSTACMILAIAVVSGFEPGYLSSLEIKKVREGYGSGTVASSRVITAEAEAISIMLSAWFGPQGRIYDRAQGDLAPMRPAQVFGISGTRDSYVNRIYAQGPNLRNMGVGSSASGSLLSLPSASVTSFPAFSIMGKGVMNTRSEFIRTPDSAASSGPRPAIRAGPGAQFRDRPAPAPRSANSGAGARAFALPSRAAEPARETKWTDSDGFTHDVPIGESARRKFEERKIEIEARLAAGRAAAGGSSEPRVLGTAEALASTDHYATFEWGGVDME